MALTSALYTTFAGLSATEIKLSVVSANVTNADKPGYSKKEYELTYSVSTGISAPTGGNIVSQIVEPYLLEEVIGDITEAAYDSQIADYLTFLSDQIGTIDDSLTLSSAVDDLAAAFDQLSITPEDDALKAKVVTQAESVASQLREMSNEVQDLRTQADQEISSVVEKINDILENLNEVNDQIAVAEVQNLSVADLTDDRNQLLQDLSALVDIDYFVNNDNRLNVYIDGAAVLTSQVNYLAFESSGSLASGLEYPTDINGVTLNGVDITSSISSGELGALFTLRDDTLIDVQDKLNEFAETMMHEVNALLNQGASLPPRNELVGDTEGFALADAFSGTGDVRIAVVDIYGETQDFHDFDLSTYGTVGALVTAINAQLAGSATASLSADGQLQITASNSDDGVLLNQMDSSVGADNDNFSAYFGLNNLFDGTNAADIRVSEYLQENIEYLAVGRMSDSATLAIGDTAVYIGDSDLAKELNELFSTNVTFDQAGGFATQTSTISDYINKIMADVANKAADAQDRSDTTAAILDQTLTSLQNSTGVNVDEEMADLVELQSKFEAAALLVSTIRELFDELIAAVR